MKPSCPSEVPSKDNVSKSKRSEIMSRIHGRDTNSEMRVRRALHSEGFRFRLHHDKLPGKPDLVLRKHKTVVFVNGCLWHGHDCRRFRWPVANAEYWRGKISRTIQRDSLNQSALEKDGWRLKLIWDCQYKRDIQALIEELRQHG